MKWSDFQEATYVDLLEPSLLVPHYLIHCFLYYECSCNIITDSQFDDLASRLADEWDDLDHPHRKVIDREALSSGGSYLRHPLRVRQAAWHILVHVRPGGPPAEFYDLDFAIFKLDPLIEEDLGDLF